MLLDWDKWLITVMKNTQTIEIQIYIHYSKPSINKYMLVNTKYTFLKS